MAKCVRSLYSLDKATDFSLCLAASIAEGISVLWSKEPLITACTPACLTVPNSQQNDYLHVCLEIQIASILNIYRAYIMSCWVSLIRYLLARTTHFLLAFCDLQIIISCAAATYIYRILEEHTNLNCWRNTSAQFLKGLSKQIRGVREEALAVTLHWCWY